MHPAITLIIWSSICFGIGVAVGLHCLKRRIVRSIEEMENKMARIRLQKLQESTMHPYPVHPMQFFSKLNEAYQQSHRDQADEQSRKDRSWLKFCESLGLEDPDREGKA